MKNKVTMSVFVLLLLSCSSLFALETDQVKMGDNIREYYSKNKKEYTLITNRVKLNLWIDSEIVIYKSKNKKVSKPQIIVYGLDIPIGIILEQNPEKYVLDMDGDGILDFENDKAILPYWVINPVESKVKDEGAPELLDKLLEVFNSEEGATESNQAFLDVQKIFESAGSNVNYPDRDLIYRVIFYSLYINNLPSLCLRDIIETNKIYGLRYGDLHPMLLQYLCESEIRNSRMEETRHYLDYLLNLTPNFVPALVIQYKIETNIDNKNEMLATLKKEHGNHWMVKGIQR